MIENIDDLREGFSGAIFDSQFDCPVCSGLSRIIDKAYNINPLKPYAFSLRRCHVCGHWWIDPMPTQGFLDHLYRIASYSVIGVGWESEAKLQLTVPERYVVRQLINRNAGNYFEFGVGKGLLFQILRKKGWDCLGIEPGKWGSGIVGVYPTCESLPKSRKYDVLVALDVLEHVRNPAVLLRSLQALAAPGATLYLAFPNCQSLRALLHHGKWRMVRPLGHVHFWSKKSVMQMLENCDLGVKELFTSDLVEWRDVPKPPRKLYGSLAQALGLGDQWIVKANFRE
jgi:SAM-dependent methyltransferase